MESNIKFLLISLLTHIHGLLLSCFLLEIFATGRLLRDEVFVDVNQVRLHIKSINIWLIYWLRRFWSNFESITPSIYQFRQSWSHFKSTISSIYSLRHSWSHFKSITSSIYQFRQLIDIQTNHPLLNQRLDYCAKFSLQCLLAKCVVLSI